MANGEVILINCADVCPLRDSPPGSMDTLFYVAARLAAGTAKEWQQSKRTAVRGGKANRGMGQVPAE
jgi:hypothetical protein